MLRLSTWILQPWHLGATESVTPTLSIWIASFMLFGVFLFKAMDVI